MRCALVLLALCALSAARANVSYCGAKMCGNSNDHTFCRYQPGPSLHCKGYIPAPLTAEEKLRIVARLNRRRSEAAAGRLRGFAPAGNMLKLRWVEELAREAQRWADQCRAPSILDERDTCRDLFSTTVGQCIATVVGEAPGLRVESLVDVWYMQSMHYKGNVTYYIQPMSEVSYYGDFAQIVWARSYMVGCGRSRFMSEWNGRLRSVERLVCNIAPRGPQPSRPLWAPAEPTSVCPPRSEPDSVLTALCNYQRYLDASSDVDGALTIEEHILLSIVLEIENNNVLDYLGSLDEFYMTKLAVVTMDSNITTPSYYNPVQKRHLMIPLGLDDSIVKIEDVVVENDFHEIINATRIIMKPGQSTEVQKYETKKINVIGRPKPYNVEDLDGVDGGHNSLRVDINQHDDLPHRNVTKIDRDVYLDYAYVDTYEDVTSVETTTSSAIDAETVRELQEALDRMELKLGEKSSGKVLRELRNPDVQDIPPDANNQQNLQQANKYISQQNGLPEAYQSKSSDANLSDKSPMLSMVLKYLPYLKPYQKELLGSGSSSTVTLVISYSLFSFGVVVTFCSQ